MRLYFRSVTESKKPLHVEAGTRETLKKKKRKKQDTENTLKIIMENDHRKQGRGERKVVRNSFGTILRKMNGKIDKRVMKDEYQPSRPN